METLKEHFSYERDFDELPELFENLSRQLRIIHSNNMIVPKVNANEIVLGEAMAYHPVRLESDNPNAKRRNLLDFNKIMIGAYLSLGTGFKDFSSVDDSWFLENFDSIFDTIHYDDFDKEYFSSVFFDGKNDYYCDYLDRKRQSESLQGNTNVVGYKKVLRNAGSSLYEELSDEESNIKEKNANLQSAFNPILIIISLLIITIIVTMMILIS